MNELTKTILVYVLFYAYMALVVIVGELVGKKTKIDSLVIRKWEHIAASFVWVLCFLLSGCSIHTMILNFTGLIALTVVTFSGIMKTVERDDIKRSYGLIYFGLSTMIVLAIAFFFDKNLYILTGIDYFCLALGDGLAPLFARLFKKHNPKVIENKTVMGSLCVFVVSALVALTFSQVFSLGYSVWMILSVGAVSATAEIFSVKGLDNLLIVFAVFGYTAMYHYGLVPEYFMIILLIAYPMVLLDGAIKALTYFGNLYAYLYLILATYFGGPSIGYLTIVCYVISIFTAGTSHIIRKKRGEEVHHHERTFFQIFANSVAPLSLAVLYYATGGIYLPLLLGALAAVIEQYADTVASDLGRISKKDPINITSFKRIQSGISGGVSLIGTTSSLIACGVALCFSMIFVPELINIWTFLILLAIIFGGVIIDSVIGGAFQALYKCEKCGKLVENKKHCEEVAIKIKGISWMNNSMVNMISGIITSGIVLLVFFLI